MSAPLEPGEIERQAHDGRDVTCPSWCTVHPSGEVHQRVIGDDGCGSRVVLSRDALNGRREKTEVLFDGIDDVMEFPFDYWRAGCLDELAAMLLAAAEEARQLTAPVGAED
jgi:hypothetical protein